jgi:hypothetical protein
VHSSGYIESQDSVPSEHPPPVGTSLRTDGYRPGY